MNSDGCRLTTPSDSQRWLPFTSRPMPGISTSTSSTMPARNSHGAIFCQPRSGTWKATSAGDQADRQINALAHQEIGFLEAG